MSNDILIKDIFKEDIERPIQGVIQAGQQDDSIILSELKEYVMTYEVEKRIEEFYKHYVGTLNTSTDKMGVWISGFFGSGKSHLLKILSYLLGHKVSGGKSAYSYFENKTNNKELLQLMKTADESESETILFNIDSITSNNASDDKKILEAFLKVFNEFLGYSNTDWIADIERSLDDEGKYGEFKEQFKLESGTSWEESRSKVLLKRKYFIKAMSSIGYDEETSRGFLDGSKKGFSIDSKGFSQLVAKYCESKSKNYRLIFLIDEVGQYIGENSNLMLNLQTVVEDLGNHTKGHAWVIVTSQEKIDFIRNLKLDKTHSSTGETKESVDFSKIQGRFATRLNLSSANADEVIKKRLLAKKDTEYSYLKAKFESQEQSINNKLKFDNLSSTIISGFSDGDEFAESYPFVPYQFTLLQDVFENVRLKGEAGKSLAYGERSLLNAFQEVAIELKNSNTDRISIFADFYDTIEKFLDSSVVKTITKASKREGISDYDIKVLKTLYMIKDIDYVKANLENITTLFIDDINCVKNIIQEKVKSSLNHLERVHLIEKLADETYRFLSDEEQEMNNAIKKMPVDDEKVKGEISKALFEGILSSTSCKYNNYTFSFNRKFDDYSRGNAIHNITLQVLSGETDVTEAKMQSTEGCLVMLLPSTVSDYEDSFIYCEQIANYNRTIKSSITPLQKRILDKKLEQSNEFRKKGQESLKNACSNARFYIQGKEFTYQGDINNQVNKALNNLIENTFTKLQYIENIIPFKDAKNKLSKYIAEGYEDLIGIPKDKVNALAIDEIKRFLDKNNSYEKKSVRDVVNEFTKVPYGWNENDILGIICVLIFNNKLKLRYLNNVVDVDDKKFIDRLMKVPEQEKLIIELEVDVPKEVKSKASRIIKEFFGTFEMGDTYDLIGAAIKQGIEESMKNPLEEIKNRQKRQSLEYPYPGNMKIMKLQNVMEELIYINDPKKLIEEVIEMEDDLADWFDDIEDLGSFYNKTPIDIFDKGVKFLSDKKEELNIISSRSSEIKSSIEQVERILKDENPYRNIPNIELLIKRINEITEEEKNKEKDNQRAEIEKIKKSLHDIEDFYSENTKVLEFIQKERKEIDSRINNFESLESFTAIIATGSLLNSQLYKLNNSINEYEKSLKEKPAPLYKKDDTSKKEIICDPPAKEKKEIFISQLIESMEINDIEIDSLQKLDSYFEKLSDKLKSRLLSELKEHDLIIKK